MKCSATPSVLVLLACRNGGNWLEEQLDSIFQQQNVEVHVLVRDDGSTDNTRSVLHQYRDRSIEILPECTPSGSAGASFRALFTVAQVEGYDFVALADQDDIWMQDKLASAIELMRQTTSDGYSCAVEAFWPNGKRRILRQSARRTTGDMFFEGGGQGCTYVMRCELFLLVRRFCIERPEPAQALHYHDWLIYLISRAHQLSWYFDGQQHIQYRQHSANEIGARTGTGLYRRAKLIRSGWFAEQIKAAARSYLEAGGSDKRALEIAQVILADHGVARSVRLASFVLTGGRRRVADRLVLIVAALLGKI